MSITKSLISFSLSFFYEWLASPSNLHTAPEPRRPFPLKNRVLGLA
jgi:hypothetical protein